MFPQSELPLSLENSPAYVVHYDVSNSAVHEVESMQEGYLSCGKVGHVDEMEWSCEMELIESVACFTVELFMGKTACDASLLMYYIIICSTLCALLTTSAYLIAIPRCECCFLITLPLRPTAINCMSYFSIVFFLSVSRSDPFFSHCILCSSSALSTMCVYYFAKLAL